MAAKTILKHTGPCEARSRAPDITIISLTLGFQHSHTQEHTLYNNPAVLLHKETWDKSNLTKTLMVKEIDPMAHKLSFLSHFLLFSPPPFKIAGQQLT